MFRAYRLFRYNSIQCRPNQHEKNFLRCITTRDRPTSPISQSQQCAKLAQHLRQALFKYDPPPIIGGTFNLESFEATFSSIRTFEELSYLLAKILPNLSRWSYRMSLDSGYLFKSIISALEICSISASKHADTLRGLAAIAELYQSVPLPVPLPVVIYGMKAAACANSPAAMESYLGFLGSRAQEVTLEDWELITKQILVATRSMPRRTSKSFYQKRAWARIVTGWEMDRAGRGPRRAFCMHDALTQRRNGIEGLGSYFRLMKRFCPAEGILQIWLKHHLSDGSGPGSSPANLNYMFNSFIQALLVKCDPERAWKVALTMEPRFGAIWDRTWKLLLQHPEHIGESPLPRMDKAILDALERYLFHVERQFAVRWVHGEDGFYVAKEQNHSTKKGE